MLWELHLVPSAVGIVFGEADPPKPGSATPGYNQPWITDHLTRKPGPTAEAVVSVAVAVLEQASA